MPRKISILTLLDIVTGETTELARFEGVIEAPFFHGDGEIFYNADGRMYRFSMADGSIAQIPTGDCIRCNNDHVPSPDGRQLAVSNNDDGIGSRIYILNLYGEANPRLITPDAPSYLHGWSPDGKTLAYCASRNGDYDVYTIPATRCASPMSRDLTTGRNIRRTDGIFILIR